MNAFRTKLLAGLFVPALALAAGVASAGGDTGKITGQAATTGSTNTNDKSTATTGMSSSKSSTASGAFARLDTNHDGKLSAAEAAADSKVQGMWKKFDANSDGTVSQAEFTAHQAELK